MHQLLDFSPVLLLLNVEIDPATAPGVLRHLKTLISSQLLLPRGPNPDLQFKSPRVVVRTYECLRTRLPHRTAKLRATLRLRQAATDRIQLLQHPCRRFAREPIDFFRSKLARGR